ncbi:MAG: GNAT family protein [Thermoleophilia bacterium]
MSRREAAGCCLAVHEMATAVEAAGRRCLRATNAGLARLGWRVVREGAKRPPLPRLDRSLRGDRVLLRRFDADDAAELVAIDSASDLRYWANWRMLATPDEARRWIQSQENQRSSGEGLVLAVVEAAADRVCGMLEVHRIDWNYGRASIGLWLIPEARGRGLMAEALAMFVRWIFSSTTLERLECLTLAENEHAIALAESCGFRREGVLRRRVMRDGHHRDAVLLSLLREDLS